VRGEVFVVGDAGVKFLMTRQLASGDIALDLRIPAEGWVQDLWRTEAMYPVPSPYVRHVDGKRYIMYPLTFPALSAPFYRLLGFRGLYVLPLLATWGAWFVLWWWCRAWEMPPLATASALAALAFASPLTYYSATFWEHGPAVALAFAGLALLLGAPRRPPSGRQALVGGLLLGASGWLREEHFLMVALLLAVGLACRWWKGACFGVHMGRRAVVGLVTPCVLFVAVNLAAYGHALGPHSLGALGTLKRSSASQLARRSGTVLVFHLSQMVDYFPLVFLALGGAVVLVVRRRDEEDGRAGLLTLLAVLFCLGVPLLLRSAGGRQWGSRFLLVVMPLLCLVLALVLRAAWRSRWRWIVVGVFATVGVVSARVNTVEAARSLRRNYQARLVPFRFVQASGARLVAVAHGFVSQQLAGTFAGRSYVLTPRGKNLRALARAMAERGESRFLFLCYPEYGCGPFQAPYPPQVTFFSGDRPLAHFTLGPPLDRYIVYEGVVPARPPAR
jgi:hypothetical protein